jgi:hypothetical protein
MIHCQGTQHTQRTTPHAFQADQTHLLVAGYRSPRPGGHVPLHARASTNRGARACPSPTEPSDRDTARRPVDGGSPKARPGYPKRSTPRSGSASFDRNCTFAQKRIRAVPHVHLVFRACRMAMGAYRSWTAEAKDGSSASPSALSSSGPDLLVSRTMLRPCGHGPRCSCPSMQLVQ